MALRPYHWISVNYSVHGVTDVECAVEAARTFRAQVDRAPGVMVRAPEVVAAMDISGVANRDIHPDGRRFIAAVDDVSPAPGRVSGTSAESRYLVVLNWFTELKALTRNGTR